VREETRAPLVLRRSELERGRAVKMFVVVIDQGDEVEVQKQLGALNATCDAIKPHMRVECDAPANLDEFTRGLPNAKVVK
jgi:hypothetical protein